MKNYILLALVVMLLIVSSCGDDEPMEANCLTEKIEAFKLDQATCENASIIKYNFQNQEVYGFTQGICIADGGTDVILADCSNVCFIGGITGNQDCNGDLFFDVAEEIEIIWENK